MKFKMLFFLLFPLLCSCIEIETPSENIDNLFDNYFREIISRNPETASQLGLTPQMGYEYDKSKLTDNSIKAIEEEFEIAKKYREKLSKYDFTKLSSSQKIAGEIFKVYLDNIIDSEKFKFHAYEINHIFGIHYSLTNLMTKYHYIQNKKDVEDFISRLNQFPQRFNDSFEILKKKENDRMFPSQQIIKKNKDILEDFVSTDVIDNPFYKYFSEQVYHLHELNKVEKEEFLVEAEKAITEKVYSSYNDFIGYLENISEFANEDTGVWKLPDGDEYYKYCLRKHTTTDLTPKEIHRLGLKEVKRIQAEMLVIFDSLGFKDGKTFGEIEGKYWNSLDGEYFHYSRTEEGKEQALQDYLKILRETEKKLTELFSLIPKTPVTVKRIPENEESYKGQHYEMAPMDGSRPAAFYTNLSWLPFKPGMQTLLFHETVPGHHLQIAIAQEKEDNYIFKNLTFFTGYIEGWALYAEKLAYENGWFEDVYSRLGYLNSELFRAARLVVDTGIHHKKWSREKAFNYMKDNIGWGSYGEIDRYTVWPGQACAYKIGELIILELREKAKKEQGNYFDIKEFHKIILENGAVPLELLEEIVNDYLD